MRVQITKPDSAGYAAPYEVPEQQPSVAFVSSPEAFGRYVGSIDYDPEAERLVGFSVDFAANDLFESATLGVPEKDLLVTVLNDLVQFESALSVVAVWERKRDELKLLHLLPESFPQGIGRTGADGYAVFQDGSLLLVLRHVGEGVFHEVIFLRVLPDGTPQRLLTRSFYYDSGQPKRGLGYELSGAFGEEPVVYLTGLQRQKVPLYGDEEGATADVLDEDKEVEAVNLWELAQQDER